LLLFAAAAAILVGAVLFGGDLVAPSSPDVGGDEADRRALADAAPGDGDASLDDSAPVASADRSLPPGAILVLDAAGRPIRRAQIMTTPETVANMDHAIRLGHTDDEGLLFSETFNRLPRRYVWARSSAGVAGPAPYAPDAGTVLALGAGRAVEGVVRTPSGEPLSGVVVGGVWTDAQGRYRVEGLFPGTPKALRVFLAGWPPVRMRPRPVVTLGDDETVRTLDLVLDPPEGPALLAKVVVPPGEDPREVELVIEIDGKVGDLEGDPGPDGLARVLLGGFPGKTLRVGARYPGFVAPLVPVEIPDGPKTVEVRLELAPEAPDAGPAVRVVDTEGKPVVDAEVGHDEDPERPRRAWTRSTDEAGRTRVSPKWVGKHFYARVPGRAISAWTQFPKDAEEIVLTVRPGARVIGRVLDRATRAPLPDLEVHLHLGSDPSGLEWSTRTDEDGRYRFDGVPPGLLALPYATGMHRIARIPDAEDLLQANDRADLLDAGYARVLAEGETFERDLLVPRRPGRPATFRVGSPQVSGLPRMIQVTHRYRTPNQAQSREWSLALDPAKPCFEIFLGEGVHVIRVVAGTWFVLTPEIRIEGDGAPAEHELVLSRLTPVEVQIVDPSGAPARIRDVLVKVRACGHVGSDSGESPTDSNGRADITDLLPAPGESDCAGVTVEIRSGGDAVFTGGAFSRPGRTLAGPELLSMRRAEHGGPLVLTLPIKPFDTIAIPVVDAAGAPQAGVRVALEPSGSFVEREAVSDATGTIRVRVRSEEGYLEALPPHIGELELDDYLEDPELRTRRAPSLVVSRRREVVVLFADEEGRPRPRLPVSIEGKSLMTDADGRLRLEVEQEKATRWARVDGHREVEIEIPPGVRAVTATLPTMRDVSVSVIVPDDFRGDRIDLEIHGPAAGEEILRRSSRGFVGTIRIPRESIRIEAGDREGLWSGETVVSEGDRTARIPLSRRPLHPLVVQFADMDGDPLGKRTCSVTLGMMRGRTIQGTTDANGEFRVELTAGTYRVRASVVGCRGSANVRKIEIPRHEPLVVRLRPEDRQTVVFLFAGRVPKDLDTRVRAVLVDASGRETVLSRTGGGSGLFGGNSAHITYVAGTRAGRIVIEYGAHRFRLEYPGHPVTPPRFEVK